MFVVNGPTPFNVAAGLPVWVLVVMVAVSWVVILLMRINRRIGRIEAVGLILAYLTMLGWLAMTGATA